MNFTKKEISVFLQKEDSAFFLPRRDNGTAADIRCGPRHRISHINSARERAGLNTGRFITLHSASLGVAGPAGWIAGTLIHFSGILIQQGSMYEDAVGRFPEARKIFGVL